MYSTTRDGGRSFPFLIRILFHDASGVGHHAGRPSRAGRQWYKEVVINATEGGDCDANESRAMPDGSDKKMTELRARTI